MNKRVKTVTKVILAVGLFAATAEAGVPLNGLQGDGGIAFNPLAYLAGTYDKDSKDRWGEWVSKPQVGAWYVNLNDADYWDYHVAWFVNDHLTLVGAYVDTGDQNSSSKLGLGEGLVLSAQYAF